MGFSINQGWVSPARHVPSPNHDARPAGQCVDLLVIHNISLPPGQYGGPWIEALFTNQLDPQAHPYFREIHQMQVSAHFLIRRDGELLQFVSVQDRAWHAGQSCFEGRERCNDFSIGIELEGCDDDIFTEAQYQQLNALTAFLLQIFPEITADRISGHEHIAAGRKTDPGPHFDWSRYLAAVRSSSNNRS